MSCCKHRSVFGPVDSRRLGRSLGINLVPFKTCSMDCIYCECGSTTCLTNARKNFFPVEKVLQELDEAMEKNRVPGTEEYMLDYITFSGLGEPSLHTGFGELLRCIREKYPRVKTCLLTNASLFYDPVLRREAAAVHLVIPSLDGSNEEEFLKINRPEKSVTFRNILDGIISFRRETVGKVKMFLEIFLVPGINDSSLSAERFRLLAEQIKPDAVQLNYLDRPGAVCGLAAVSGETLDLFSSVISKSCKVEIPSRKNKAPGTDFARIEFEMLSLLRENRPVEIAALAEKMELPETECVRHLRQLRKAGFAEEIFDAAGQGGFFRITETGKDFLQEKY